MKLILKDKKHLGKLITFCGLDGCGKTTMIGMLKKYLKEHNIIPVLTKQPTDAIRSSEIFRTYMDNPDHTSFDYRALSLSAAGDRIQHTDKYIVPLLESGNIVISDRYFYSCIANLKARGYMEDCWIYEIASHIQKPDLSFFLDVDVDMALKRVRSRENEKNKYVDVDLQHRLREQYLLIAKETGGTVISSNKEPDECFKEIMLHTERILMQYV
ncbi:MAG TPA: dTMP kinase [Clostridiales bacterium]|nr:MAG: dTMP kinase [Candidatus Margulisbacteria bacterium GWF2_35_9]HAN21167.1 dTMP kinase [Clostridiales bacterium]